MSRNKNIQLILFSIIVIIALIYMIFIKPNYYRFNGGQIYFEPILATSFVANDSYKIYAYEKYMYISSSNGMKKITDQGEIIWDKSYYVENPKFYAKGEYMAIVNMTNKNAYIFNSEGLLVEITVDYPIIMADINENGALLLVQENSDHHIIQLYNREGVLVAKRGTSFMNDGYPIDISLSDSGNNMATSYAVVNNDIIGSEISIFNFDDVGEKEPENIIGGASLENVLAGEVAFIDENNLVIIGDTLLRFYSISDSLVLENEVAINNRIIEYGINDEGVIILYGKMIEATSVNIENHIVVYNKTGEEVMTDEREDTVNRINGEDNKYYLLTSEGVEKYVNNKRVWKATLQREVENIIELGESTYILTYSQGYEIVKIKEL